MSQFVTLNKKDSLFSKYIWGDFSQNLVAIPIESLNIETEQESVTFEVKEKKHIKSPHPFFILLRLMKWNYFFLIFVPFYYVWVKNTLYDRLYDVQSFYMAVLSSIFLFAGLNIRNDVLDHVNGFDRIIKSRNPKPILSGWVTARSANNLAWGFIFIALILALPALYRQIEALRAAVVVFSLFIIGNFLTKNSYKYSYFSEFILFLILGPGLCAGYQTALGSGVDTEILVFGSVWGTGVLFLLYINQFANLFETSQAGIGNTLTKMGFDHSKKFLGRWWALFLLFWVVHHHYYASIYWTWFATATLVFWSFQIFIKLSNVESPMGSQLYRVRRTGYRIFLLMVSLLILEQTWYLYTKTNWSM